LVVFSGHTGYIADRLKITGFLLKMIRFQASQLIVLLLLAAPLCLAQTRIAISYPDLEQKEQVVHISYHIDDSDASDRFLVTLLVTDQRGERLNARTLSGDVGHNVSGGGTKHIAWDAGADSVSLTEGIDVRILVEALSPTRRELMALEEAQRDKEKQDELAGEDLMSQAVPDDSASPQANPRTFSRSGLVFRSLLYPGWGLSIVERKPHWIKGLAAYGCVAGSVILNRKAIETYGQIDDFEDYPSKDELYEKAVMQDNISEILAYGAVGIWVADFIWTLVGTRQMKTFTVQPKMDPLSYAPMIGFTYSF